MQLRSKETSENWLSWILTMIPSYLRNKEASKPCFRTFGYEIHFGDILSQDESKSRVNIKKHWMISTLLQKQISSLFIHLSVQQFMHNVLNFGNNMEHMMHHTAEFLSKLWSNLSQSIAGFLSKLWRSVPFSQRLPGRFLSKLSRSAHFSQSLPGSIIKSPSSSSIITITQHHHYHNSSATNHHRHHYYIIIIIIVHNHLIIIITSTSTSITVHHSPLLLIYFIIITITKPQLVIINFYQ